SVLYSDMTFLFFHAEAGIRDRNVTGVQTCALPISYLTQDHAKLLATMPFLKGCETNVVVDNEQRSPFDRGSTEIDGYTEMFFDKIGRASCRERVQCTTDASGCLDMVRAAGGTE